MIWHPKFSRLFLFCFFHICFLRCLSFLVSIRKSSRLWHHFICKTFATSQGQREVKVWHLTSYLNSSSNKNEIESLLFCLWVSRDKKSLTSYSGFIVLFFASFFRIRLNNACKYNKKEMKFMVCEDDKKTVWVMRCEHGMIVIMTMFSWKEEQMKTICFWTQERVKWHWVTFYRLWVEKSWRLYLANEIGDDIVWKGHRNCCESCVLKKVDCSCCASCCGRGNKTWDPKNL